VSAKQRRAAFTMSG